MKKNLLVSGLVAMMVVGAASAVNRAEQLKKFVTTQKALLGKLHTNIDAQTTGNAAGNIKDECEALVAIAKALSATNLKSAYEALVSNLFDAILLRTTVAYIKSNPRKDFAVFQARVQELHNALKGIGIVLNAVVFEPIFDKVAAIEAGVDPADNSQKINDFIRDFAKKIDDDGSIAGNAADEECQAILKGLAEEAQKFVTDGGTLKDFLAELVRRRAEVAAERAAKNVGIQQRGFLGGLFR